MNKISVIVPIYKVEQYLNKCLDNIIYQTYQNLEIILVDDGSPDNCGKICDEYAKKDNRIIVIHKANGGLSDARNAGLKIATGDFISFIDSDDYLELNAYEIMLNAIIKNNIDLVACNYYLDNGNNLKTTAYNYNENRIFDRKEAYYNHLKNSYFSAHVWNKLVKREVIGELEFEKGKISEDEFYTYQLIDRTKKCMYIEDVLYNYLQRDDSIIKEFNIKRLDAIEGMYNRLKYTEEHYNEFYSRNKILFLYTLDRLKMKNIIKLYRKKIKFPMKEFLKFTIIDKYYIILSYFW